MYRVSMDDVMVFNPTPSDFVVDWDGYKTIIPAQDKDLGWGKGMREVKRYIALYYCRHMKDKLINEMGDKEAMELLAKREKEGKDPITDKHVESLQIWAKVPKTNDPKAMANIYPTLFLGVVREFGLEFSEEERQASMDTRTTEEKVMEELQSRKFVPKTPEVKPLAKEGVAK